MSRRSRRSVELPLLKPFISASVVDPSALSPVSFSGMDMEKETILVTIHGEDDVSLRGYRICDFDQHHWFEFPSTFVLPAGSTVTIFCCPGLYLEKQPGQLFLLWLNKDGSVRSKNVLNDEKETVYLHNSAGQCISSCSRENGKDALIIRHSHLSNTSRNFLSKCKLFVCYVRILSLLYAAWCATTDPQSFILWYIFADFLDLLARCIWLGDSDIKDRDLPIDPLLDAMNTTGDRLSTIVIMVNIIIMLPSGSNSSFPTIFPMNPPPAFDWLGRFVFCREYFIGFLILDIISHWMRKNAEIYYASSLSSVTESSKTPVFHIDSVIESNERVAPSDRSGSTSAVRKRRLSRGSKGKTTHHLGSENAIKDYQEQQDAVYIEPCPETDELDFIDILRVRFPYFLSAVTSLHEVTLVLLYFSVQAWGDSWFNSWVTRIAPTAPLRGVINLALLCCTCFKGALLFAQFLTATSRVSFEVLSWKTRRQVISKL